MDKIKRPRFDPETQGILDELLKLEKKDALRWALDVAEHILPVFEAHQPEDPRPRQCIELGREWMKGTVPFKEIRATALASHAAARNASDPLAIAAARACGHAIATIHVQTHSVGAALYGLKSCPDEHSKRAERAWQINHLEEIKQSLNK